MERGQNYTSIWREGKIIPVYGERAKFRIKNFASFYTNTAKDAHRPSIWLYCGAVEGEDCKKEVEG